MKRYGTRISHQGFCTFCGWAGAHWFGKGSKGNAQAELNWHMGDSDQCMIQKMQRPSIAARARQQQAASNEL